MKDSHATHNTCTVSERDFGVNDSLMARRASKLPLEQRGPNTHHALITRRRQTARSQYSPRTDHSTETDCARPGSCQSGSQRAVVRRCWDRRRIGHRGGTDECSPARRHTHKQQRYRLYTACAWNLIDSMCGKVRHIISRALLMRAGLSQRTLWSAGIELILYIYRVETRHGLMLKTTNCTLERLSG